MWWGQLCYTFWHMTKLLDWIKRNKLATTLLVILGLVLFSQLRSPSLPAPLASMSRMSAEENLSVSQDSGMMLPAAALKSGGFGQEAAPAPEVTDRMVVTSSYLSLVVNSVNDSIAQMREYVHSIGGYMVNSNISRPEEGGTGTLTVRIPADKLDEALGQLKGQAVKVVSENLDGQDVTDQFVDNAARLVILEQNKARFEEIMKGTSDVTEILQVQNEIFRLQSQIDSIKGRQQYLEQTAKMALVTLYLSTDELALPYAPTNSWRPEVIFKLAVRSLFETVQSLGTLAIWVGVFAVIWLPILLIVLWVSRRRRRKVTQPTQAL